MKGQTPQQIGLLIVFWSLVYAVGGLMLVLGGLHWLWTGIRLGSLSMFVVGLFPWTGVITAPIGTWAMLFGWPRWVEAFFG